MQIVFPTSTAPSLEPSESGGRLVNAYAEKAPVGARNGVIYRRAPGCDKAFTAGSGDYRCALLAGTVLYVANGDAVYSVTKAAGAYTVTTLGGTLDGTGPVFMAHNNKSPTHDILIVTSAGVSRIASGSVSSFSDADLPSVNSLAFQDGYFFFTTASGLSYASDLNDTNVTDSSFVKAEAQVDGLTRCIPFRRDILLMGADTTEFWSNVGNATGYPYSRGPVITHGLISADAVAGWEPGFPGPLVWVGGDSVVYRLDGYSPVAISTAHHSRMIEAVADKTDLKASVHIAAGHPFWVLRAPEWTMVYDIGTGEWHERRSIGLDTWRMVGGINAFGEWLVFDTTNGGDVYRIDERSQFEAAGPLVFDIISTQQHNFPGRTAVDRASFDFVTGVGKDRGISPIQTEPKVSISWSDNGGRTFGNPLVRSLGTQGEIVSIDVWRTGLTGPQGRQWRLQISDPVHAALLGGSMFGEGMRP